MHQRNTYLLEQASALLDELDIGEAAQPEHHSCELLGTGIEGLLRGELRQRWNEWPPESTTDGSTVYLCFRSARHTISVIGLTHIDFTSNTFPFRVELTRSTPQEWTATVFIGQVDKVTGGPPRLTGAVIIPEHSDAAGQVEATLLAGRHQTPIDWTLAMTLTLKSRDTPSRHVVEQRVRNRIVEYLELASSFEAQLEYQRNAPIAYVPSELINQWEDWVHTDPRTVDWYPDVYSSDEIAAMKRFHAAWEATADSIPNPLPPIEQVQLLPEWNNLRRAAEQALSVFLIRGTMSNDHVELIDRPDIHEALHSSSNPATKPLLLLDIDGVLSPFGGGPPPGFKRETVGSYEVIWSPQHRDWLLQLSQSFQLVWATTWEHSANEAMSPILQLGQLSVIEFDRGTGDTWKLPSVQEFVGNRPAAWIDDDLYLDAHEWARQRDAPTLLIRTSSSVGLTKAHVDQLQTFADHSRSTRPTP